MQLAVDERCSTIGLTARAASSFRTPFQRRLQRLAQARLARIVRSPIADHDRGQGPSTSAARRASGMRSDTIESSVSGPRRPGEAPRSLSHEGVRAAPRPCGSDKARQLALRLLEPPGSGLREGLDPDDVHPWWSAPVGAARPVQRERHLGELTSDRSMRSRFSTWPPRALYGVHRRLRAIASKSASSSAAARGSRRPLPARSGRHDAVGQGPVLLLERVPDLVVARLRLAGDLLALETLHRQLAANSP